MEVFNILYANQTMQVATAPMVVTGKLVEEPNRVLRKWCIAISLVYSAYYSTVFVEYIMGNPPIVHWIMLVAAAFYFALWLPLCGLRSAEKALAKLRGANRMPRFSNSSLLVRQIARSSGWCISKSDSRHASIKRLLRNEKPPLPTSRPSPNCGQLAPM